MVHANYFDGRSTRVRAVNLTVVGENLVIAGEDIDLRIPFVNVKVDERLGRAPRRLHFSDGTLCEVRDLDALDVLLSSTAHRDGRVDRLQRHLQFVLFSLFACVLLVLVVYKWGLPWAAAQGAQRLPPAVGRTLSAQALEVLDHGILMPSTLGAERQRALRARFHTLRLPEGGMSDSTLLFRSSPQLGANAFTLPDGTTIVLDELVTSLGDEQEILAVLAHELGHAHGRHGLQLLLQSTAVGAFLAFYVGDISHLLAAAPAAAVQARYSQQLEEQADDYGAQLLLHNGMSPRLLVDALKKLANSHPDASKGGYLSSHPASDERIRHLLRLAAGARD